MTKRFIFFSCPAANLPRVTESLAWLNNCPHPPTKKKYIYHANQKSWTHYFQALIGRRLWCQSTWSRFIFRQPEPCFLTCCVPQWVLWLRRLARNHVDVSDGSTYGWTLEECLQRNFMENAYLRHDALCLWCSINTNRQYIMKEVGRCLSLALRNTGTIICMYFSN